MQQRKFGAIGAALLMAAAAVNSQAAQEFKFGYDMPVQVKAVVNETGCENSPGPVVTLEGELLLGGLKASLIFQNNTKGTHSTTVTYSTNVALVLPGSGITLPKQPVLGGVGGNPHIWIQFCDAKNNNTSDEIYLGRCVQGLTVSKDLVSAVAASTFVTVAECNQKGGPLVTFGGNLKLSGLKAKIIFRNNEKGTHTAETISEVTLVVDGTEVQIPKQPSRGGAGGNPLIWLQFEHGNSLPIGDPIFLGRCNQL
jgi:hypothetical protein